MRLKNFIINLESATTAVPRGSTDGELKIPNTSTSTSDVPMEPGIGVFTLLSGSDSNSSDYSHFNVYRTVSQLNTDPILSFTGSLSSKTEDSKGVEGSTLVVSAIE